VIRARDEFERLGIEEPASEVMPEPTFRMQPAVSPVWDTAQAVYAWARPACRAPIRA